jgi:hypothetical protein
VSSAEANNSIGFAALASFLDVHFFLQPIFKILHTIIIYLYRKTTFSVVPNDAGLWLLLAVKIKYKSSNNVILHMFE